MLIFEDGGTSNKVPRAGRAYSTFIYLLLSFLFQALHQGSVVLSSPTGGGGLLNLLDVVEYNRG